MSRIKYYNRSFRSGMRRRIFIAQNVPIKDTRPTDTLGFGRQIIVTCPICQAVMKARKAVSYEVGINGIVPGIKKGDLLITRHRYGGGTYSFKRGDTFCKGSGLPVIKEE